MLTGGMWDKGESVRDEYLQEVLERASSDWCNESGVEEKWSAVRCALVSTAEGMLGEAGRTEPDWFRESLVSLKPLIAARNAAHTRYLG
jgi:hypothetical protein